MRNSFYKITLTSIFLAIVFFTKAQSQLAPLTVEKIMRDPVWIGTSPSDIEWDNAGTLYFKWNPQNNKADSIYYITLSNKTPQKLNAVNSGELVAYNDLSFNNKRNAYVYTLKGNIFFSNTANKKTIQVTQTEEYESNPVFSFHDSCIVYNRNQNLYAWNIFSGTTTQLTDFKKGNEPQKNAANPQLNTQEEWLKNDQLKWMEILKESRVGLGISAQAAHRTVLETLTSHGSCYPIILLFQVSNDKTSQDIPFVLHGILLAQHAFFLFCIYFLSTF